MTSTTVNEGEESRVDYSEERRGEGETISQSGDKVSVYLRERPSERVGEANEAGERSEVEEEKRREEEKRELTIRRI